MRSIKTKGLIRALLLVLMAWSTGVTAAVVAEVEDNDTLGTNQFIGSDSFTVEQNADLHDDSLSTATIDGDIGLDGSAPDVTDVDFYCFDGDSGAELHLDIDYGQDSGVSVDTRMALFTDTGVLLAEDDDTDPGIGGGGSFSDLDSYIGTYRLPSSGTYCVAVSSFNNGAPNLGGTSELLDLGGSAYLDGDVGATYSGGGFFAGDYILHISLGHGNTLPVPSLSSWAAIGMILLLGMGGLAAMRRRVRVR